MRRVAVLLILTLLVLAVAPVALAWPDQPVEDERFVIAALSETYKLIYKDDHIKVRQYRAEGDVFGVFQGTFAYKEKAEIDMSTGATTQKGDMTIQTDQGKIMIRFTGVGQLVGLDKIIVKEQPWTVKGGNGDYAGLKGSGDRWSLSDAACDEECGEDYKFCVEYIGDYW